MPIAKLSIDLEARLTKFEAGLNQATRAAERSASQMERTFAGVGDTIKGVFAGLAVGASVAWISNLVTSSIDAQDALSDLNKSTGVSIDLLAGLKGAASSAGTDIEGVAAAVNKLSVNMAKDPAKFAAIGIDAKEPLEALKQLADVFASIEDPQKRAAVAAEAVGKSWSSLAPLLSDGGEALGSLVGKFQETSGVTEESARAAADLNDKLDLLKSSISGDRNRRGNSLVPILDAMVPALSDSAREAKRASQEFSPLAETMRAIIVVGGNVNYVMQTLGITIAGTAAQIRALATLDFSAFSGIREAFSEDLDKGRKSFDAWEKSIMTAGQKFSDYSNEGRGRATTTDKQAAPATAAINKFIGPAGAGGGGRSSGGSSKSVDDGARLVASLRDQIRNTQELTVLERLNLDIQDGKYKTATAANLEIARGYAATLDGIKANTAAVQEELDAQRKRLEVFADGARVFESVRTPIEALDAEILRLMTLMDAGAISMETFGRAAQQAGEQMQVLEDNAKTAVDGIDVFAKSAAKNMQTAFAEFLFDPFDKGTKSMLESFGMTVRKMIANAVSADLEKKLFGDGKGGLGGLVGKGLDWLKGIISPSADGNVFDSRGLSAYSGSIVSRPTIFPFARGIGLMGESGPEAILPLSRDGNGKLGVRGGGHSVVVNISMGAGSNASEVRRAGGAAAREILGVLSSARRYA